MLFVSDDCVAQLVTRYSITWSGIQSKIFVIPQQRDEVLWLVLGPGPDCADARLTKP